MRYLAFVAFLTLLSCQKENPLKNGDLVFIGNSSSELSSAIDAVTKTDLNTSFSHMGVLEVTDTGLYIIHSNSYSGVCREDMVTFRKNNGESGDSIYIFRTKEELNIPMQEVLEKAHSHLGDPYNRTYIMDDPGFYCSEFIYYIFEEYDVFTLNPMTFKNPGSTDFNPTWIEHYDKLGINIPEGLPGCNPNGMASSDQLIFVTKL